MSEPLPPDSSGFSDNSPLGENPNLLPKEVFDGTNSLRINPIGGLIESLRFDGIEILGSPRRGDGKITSTHFCVPMLGPDTRTIPERAAKLPQHGPARNETWQIINHDPQSGLITVKYELKHPSYPSGLVVVVDHRLKDGQYLNKTIIENQGAEEMPIVPGWHLYWNAHYVKGNYAHKGYDGLSLNGKNISGKINPDSSFIDLSEKNTVSLPGMYEMELIQTGFPQAVLWAGSDSQGGQDQDYFCLEPIAGDLKTFGKPKSMLSPGKQKELTFGIKLIKLLIANK